MEVLAFDTGETIVGVLDHLVNPGAFHAYQLVEALLEVGDREPLQRRATSICFSLSHTP